MTPPPAHRLPCHRPPAASRRRWRRLALLLLTATLAGLVTDALRPGRVLFPKKNLPPLELIFPEP
ncbi:MAG: hypothetical protein LBC18_11405 [Opitutaceae bacterium]|nr:hypothetical protein [Opitutaceae bacterium]